MGQTSSMHTVPAGIGDQEVRLWLHNAAQAIDTERVRFRVTAGAQVGNDRTLTLQAIDRNAQAVSGRWMALVYLSTTAGGAPGGTQTVTWGGGTVLSTLTANVAYLILTSADGSAQLTVNAAAGNRHVGSAVFGDVAVGGAITWA